MRRISDSSYNFDNIIKNVSDSTCNIPKSLKYRNHAGQKTNLGDILFLDYAKF